MRAVRIDKCKISAAIVLPVKYVGKIQISMKEASFVKLYYM